jgi:hypothetical protein
MPGAIGVRAETIGAGLSRMDHGLPRAQGAGRVLRGVGAVGSMSGALRCRRARRRHPSFTAVRLTSGNAAVDPTSESG